MTPFNKFFKLIMFLTPKRIQRNSTAYWVFMRFLQHPIIFLKHIGQSFQDTYNELPTLLQERKKK